MGSYFDYRQYFEDISDELSTLRTEINDINDQWIERDTEYQELLTSKFTILTGVLLIATVLSVMFR